MSDIFEDIEEEVYSLIGEIDYGDISDLPTYWGALIDSMLKLECFRHVEDAGKVSELLEKLPPKYRDQDLLDVTLEMEELTVKTSSDTIAKDSLEALQTLAVDFEEGFLKLLERMKNANGR